MSDSSEQSSEAALEQLIESLKNAQRERRHARNWMSVLLAVVLVVFLYFGYVSVESLSDEQQMAKFNEALQAEVTQDIQPVLMEEIRSSAERIVPAYQDVFAETLDRNADAYQQMIAEEFVKLESHAMNAWPRIQEEIARMADRQVEVTRDELSQYLEPEQLRAVNEAYLNEINIYMESFLEQNFGQEIILADNVLMKLEQVAETEPDPGIANPLFSLGIMIELLGYEMQRNAVELSGNSEAEAQFDY
ncbi:MAG: hypothetical protein ACFB21_02925 [Opitutales bacterium]